MTRLVAALLVAALLAAGAAEAKGPHAVLSSNGERIEPGRPWQVKLELMEYAPALRPVLVATQGARRIAARGRVAKVEDVLTTYRVALVFPTAGRWHLSVDDGRAGFRFRSVPVGSGRPFRTDTAFGGIAAARDTPLPPEELAIRTDSADNGGTPVWLPPLFGVALAGASAAAVRIRSRRRPREASGARRRRSAGRPT